MKYPGKYSIKAIIMFLCFCVITAPSTSSLNAQSLSLSSPLIGINDSLKSIVAIKAENAAIGRSPAKAILDTISKKFITFSNIRTARYERYGAGVIIDSKGLIITNAHIVRNAGRIFVALNDKTGYEAKLIGISNDYDLAFIGINVDRPLSAIDFADSSKIKLNEKVYTIGSSELFQGTISQGKITGIGKRGKAKDQKNYNIDLIQTNLDLRKGDSGAPLFNDKGELLGLLFAANLHKIRTSYAIPSNKIKKYYMEYLERTENM